jgi:DNA-directed RNA polymerase specialized sigma24 family protein
VAIRTSSRLDFEEFVAVCGPALLRTAYLLTLDRTEAEDLLDLALARAWLGWDRQDEPPQLLVRRLMVDEHVSWGPRRWAAPHRLGASVQTGVAAELARLSRRQRCAVVLRYVERLSPEDAADVLGSSLSAVQAPAVERLAGRAPELAALADGLVDPPLRERLQPVDRDAETLRRRRRLSTVVGVCAASAVALAFAVLVPRLDSYDTPPLPARPVVRTVVEPPLLAGHPLPPVTRVENVDYQYFRSEEAPTGYGSLLVELPASSQPMALMWSTPASSTYIGDVVLAIDGDVVSRGAAGGLESGVVVSAHSAHRVTLRVTRPDPRMRLGLAIYRWPRG